MYNNLMALRVEPKINPLIKREVNMKERWKEIRICAHTIEYNYDGYNGEITESEEQHIRECLIENYVEGELNMLNDKDIEIRGWWRIKKEK